MLWDSRLYRARIEPTRAVELSVINGNWVCDYTNHRMAAWHCA